MISDAATQDAGKHGEATSGFRALTPDRVIDLAEKALGERLTALCRPLQSYINRVFELQRVSGEGVIVKFYRPGRWSLRALQDEHDFLFELHEREIPVIAPLILADGGSLGAGDGVHFALFPKKSGRALDEPGDEQWEELGRLVARTHLVGAMHPAEDRIVMSPREATLDNVRYILSRDVVPRELSGEYEKAAMEMIGLIDPMFQGVERIRIHGDCHRANIVHRPGESFYLIDFDDMAMGPPVQDIWMILPEYSRASLVEIDMFLEGYQIFRSFDRRTLKLIEPLRAMRYIHFDAWCARQTADGAVTRLAPGWGTVSYWRQAINDLRGQMDEIAAGRDFFWGM